MTTHRATTVYLHALNDMPNTKPGELAAVADQMAGGAFDGIMPGHLKKPASDAMMQIETAIFTALCAANGVDWRHIMKEA